jgi:hypothetical protein
MHSRNLRRQEIDSPQSDPQPPEFTERYLLDRLIAAGIGSLEDWRALSPRARRNIFGITVSMARALDGMAKARQHPADAQHADAT